MSDRRTRLGCHGPPIRGGGFAIREFPGDSGAVRRERRSEVSPSSARHDRNVRLRDLLDPSDPLEPPKSAGHRGERQSGTDVASRGSACSDRSAWCPPLRRSSSSPWLSSYEPSSFDFDPCSRTVRVSGSLPDSSEPSACVFPSVLRFSFRFVLPVSRPDTSALPSSVRVRESNPHRFSFRIHWSSRVTSYVSLASTPRGFRS